MLLPSDFRPQVSCKEWLECWKPATSQTSLNQQGEALNMSDEDLAKILHVSLESWLLGTREAYGSGLLAYHVFCNIRNISEALWALADPTLIAAFIASMGGIYAEKTASHSPQKCIEYWLTWSQVSLSWNWQACPSWIQAQETRALHNWNYYLSLHMPRPQYSSQCSNICMPHILFLGSGKGRGVDYVKHWCFQTSDICQEERFVSGKELEWFGCPTYQNGA